MDWAKDCEEDILTEKWFKKNVTNVKIHIKDVPDLDKDVEAFFIYCLPFSLEWK